MKKLIFYLLALGLTLTACQTDDPLLTPENTDLSSQIDIQETGQNGLIGNPSRKGGDPLNFEVLENRMQWLSFISTKLIRHNTEYQNLFINELGSGSTIDASALIGTGPFATDFKVEFRDELIDYILGVVPDPDDELSKPPPPPINGPGGFGPSAEVLADEIIDYLANIHCIELYFPKGFDLSSEEPHSITSTAHPLNNSLENEGYKRLYVGVTIPDNPDQTFVTFDATVNADYLNDPLNTLIVVARPVRSLIVHGGTDCTYTEYSEVDFEDFLENM